jgi:hypothetical protein
MSRKVLVFGNVEISHNACPVFRDVRRTAYPPASMTFIQMRMVMRLWNRWCWRLLIRRWGSRSNRLYQLASPLKIAAGAPASRFSSAKPKVWIGWLRGWRYGLRCY